MNPEDSLKWIAEHLVSWAVRTNCYELVWLDDNGFSRLTEVPVTELGEDQSEYNGLMAVLNKIQKNP